MFKKILLTLSLFVFASSSFALTQNDIEKVMTTKIEKVLMILKNDQLQKKEKANDIIAIMEEVFDYKVMSRIALGKNWKKISKEQRSEFVKSFSQSLKDSFTDKLDLFSDQTVAFEGTKQTKKNRLVLKSKIKGKDEDIDVDYKFYKTKKADNWLIYDVEVKNVSILKAQRVQFANFLKEKSIEDLIAQLNEKNKE